MLILKSVLICLKRSFLLNLIVKEFFYGILQNCWLKLLLNFTCSKGNEFMREFGAAIGMKPQQEILPN